MLSKRLWRKSVQKWLMSLDANLWPPVVYAQTCICTRRQTQNHVQSLKNIVQSTQMLRQFSVLDNGNGSFQPRVSQPSSGQLPEVERSLLSESPQTRTEPTFFNLLKSHWPQTQIIRAKPVSPVWDDPQSPHWAFPLANFYDGCISAGLRQEHAAMFLYVSWGQ